MKNYLSDAPLSGKTRGEHDLLGDRQIPREYYFGVQTLRALENFDISGVRLNFHPELVDALAIIKQASAMANSRIGVLDQKVADAIVAACEAIRRGELHDQFVVDLVQGGAGTSTNMNANEVIANKALEIMGYPKGEYKHCHPNNDVNMSQSTNDAYPSAMKLATVFAIKDMVARLKKLIEAFRAKGGEFSTVIKMGRTQLQDAVPMTLGQTFDAYANTLSEEIERIEQNMPLLLVVNMGATAIGTGINADPDYTPACVAALREITGWDISAARDMIEATNDTGAFVTNSAVVKRLAVKLSKICNDLRLLSSGPRTGLGEINLPPMQPGSSIMPGKVNPVIPEVVSQVAFKVIGNDVTITIASEAAQMELNAFEPVMVQSLMESIKMLGNAMDTLRERCVVGITANVERCRDLVYNSIGLVTALNPYLGYETSTVLAQKALVSGKGIYELVLEEKLMSKEELDDILKPENMVRPRKFPKKK
jgi:aspartate ammonia-lyase